jgi:four helix bundle protein
MTPAELQKRTFRFSVTVFRFVRPLFRDADTRHVAHQALKAATSVAANYRAACLARSGLEWVAKIGVVREESDEAVYWLKFIDETGIAVGGASELAPLSQEAEELARIFAASYHTSKDNLKRGREET